MTPKSLLAGAAAALALAASARAEDAALAKAVADDYGYVFDLYKHFHQNPELSFREVETSKRLAAELKGLGFEVTTGVGDAWVRAKSKATLGRVEEGVGGYGVVAVMKNGAGPTLLIRADMDALPLEEKTGVPYASAVRSKDWLGQAAPVMHACAHDSHVAMLVGVARRLVATKDKWNGTLVLVGEPAEEIGLGARAMLADGLYTRWPKPDFALAMHTSGWDPSGTVDYTPGFALANADSVDVEIKGVGAHGSAPQASKDPIVLGSEIVVALQTLVSRENNPLDPAVVTVGSFQAGYKHNIIPDSAHLKLTVRSYKDDVRKRLLDGIRRIAEGQAASAGLPKELMPQVSVEPDYTPATYNEPALTKRVMTAIGASLGADRVRERAPSMGGEDFSQFWRADKSVPTVIYWVGSVDPKLWAAANEGKATAPSANHSPFYAPQPEPALKTGVQSMTAAALELLKK